MQSRKNVLIIYLIQIIRYFVVNSYRVNRLRYRVRVRVRLVVRYSPLVIIIKCNPFHCPSPSDSLEPNVA